MSRTRTVKVMSSAIRPSPVRITELFDVQQPQQIDILGEDLARQLVKFTAQAENQLGPCQHSRLFDYIACVGIDSTRADSPETDFFSALSGRVVSALVQALMIAMFIVKSFDRIPS